MMEPAIARRIALNILEWRARYGYNRAQQEVERRFPRGFTKEDRTQIYNTLHRGTHGRRTQHR